MVQSKLLLKFDRLKHYFLEIKETGKKSSFNFGNSWLVSCQQIHSNKVMVVDGDSLYVKGVDGLITSKPVFLGIKTADCLPIFLYEPQSRVFAAIHAGWRGLLTGIIRNTIAKMREIGAQKTTVAVAIGPHIKVCCYKVDEEQVERFLQLGLPQSIATKVSSGHFLDLGKIAKLQLILSGIAAHSIDILPICTFCDKRFFSFRRDGVRHDLVNNIIGLVK